ncbi:Mrr restriction system protein [Peribacillus simplex]|uniref:restriction endonuclease n=1 Tax=Peribacillus simplex TaxID=1478 RepID=UPI001D6EC5EA|nr:restriction endonuclease [Peribacillus simplex]CAH0207981.1 Mrr restriction system protein [Peribacillus simplex]
MAIPKHDEVRLPLLKLISDGGVYTQKSSVEKLQIFFDLTEEERNATLSSGKSVFNDRVHWAKFHMKIAGLIDFPRRGEFQISELGKELLSRNLDKIENSTLMEFPGFQAFLERSKRKSINQLNDNGSSSVAVIEKVQEESMNTPYEMIENSFEELNTILADELLDKLKEMDFFKFEDLVLDLLVKLGYGGSKEMAKQNTKRTGDGGIDGIINADRLGLNKIFVQAKRWSDTNIGRPEIQKFAGALDGFGGNNGIFITTSSFSKDACDYVKVLPNKKIVLIDGQQLAQYMIEVGLGVSVEKVYEVKRLDLDYFIEE